MRLRAEDILAPERVSALLESKKKTAPLPRRCPSEEAEHLALMAWVWAHAHIYPELDCLFHVPNGGYRHKREAVRFAKLGVKSGVPDLVLPVARHGACSLYIELKARDGHPSPAQIEWAILLAAQNTIVAFCFGWIEARETLEWYLA